MWAVTINDNISVPLFSTRRLTMKFYNVRKKLMDINLIRLHFVGKSNLGLKANGARFERSD